jgi:hypothetical protein
MCDLRDAELKNLKAGLHHFQGRSDAEALRIRDECRGERQERIRKLDRLVRSALRPGIDAGFTDEWVENCLDELMQNAIEAADWDNSYDGDVLDDRWARQLLDGRFAQTFSSLRPLETMADAAGQGGQADAAQRRLRFDAETLTVTLDGTEYPLGKPKVFEVFRTIGEAKQPPVKKAVIQGKVTAVVGRKTIRRLLNTLPSALRKTVQTNTTGYWVQLPARKERARP